MRTIAVVAQKGGQSKSTSVVNIAACLAGQGSRVLVIDTDTQANTTWILLRGESPRRPALAEVLLGDADADDAIVPTAIDGVSLIAADPSLAEVNVTLSGEVGRERRLRSALADLSTPFDVCLVDTGPTRSLLTSNVLNAVAEVVVPISPGVFGVLGLDQLQSDMALVRKFLENKTLALVGVFLTMVERTTVCRDFERGIRESLGDLIFETTIPRAVAFEEANARQRSIFEHAPRSPGAAAYTALTGEVMSRGNGQGKAKRDARRDLQRDDAA
jgi:chromosome partitioning protein